MFVEVIVGDWCLIEGRHDHFPFQKRSTQQSISLHYGKTVISTGADSLQWGRNQLMNRFQDLAKSDPSVEPRWEPLELEWKQSSNVNSLRCCSWDPFLCVYLCRYVVYFVLYEANGRQMLPYQTISLSISCTGWFGINHRTLSICLTTRMRISGRQISAWKNCGTSCKTCEYFGKPHRNGTRPTRSLSGSAKEHVVRYKRVKAAIENWSSFEFRLKHWLIWLYHSLPCLFLLEPMRISLNADRKSKRGCANRLFWYALQTYSDRPLLHLSSDTCSKLHHGMVHF